APGLAPDNAGWRPFVAHPENSGTSSAGNSRPVLFPVSLCPDFQLDASLCLENTQDSKKMCGTRVSVWTQHSMETLTGNFRECTELFETNCCVDEISEYSFPNSFFAAEVSINRLRQ